MKPTPNNDFLLTMNNLTIKGSKQVSKEDFNQELFNTSTIKDELTACNSDINHLENNDRENMVTDVIDSHDWNLYNSNGFIKEEGCLNDQLQFASFESYLKEEQTGSSENQVKPIFKEGETHVLESNILIRDSSHCDSSREESDCFVA